MAEIHELKTWPEFYVAVRDGSKRFEIRRNDRDFKVGDVLVLYEFDPSFPKYTGEKASFRVTYIVHGPNFGIALGTCVMSIEPLSALDRPAPPQGDADAAFDVVMRGRQYGTEERRSARDWFVAGFAAARSPAQEGGRDRG